MIWTVDSWYRDARRDAEAGAEQIRNMAGHYMKTLQQALPQASEQQIVGWLEAENRKRLAAVPDFKKYPELRCMPEFIAASWRGMKDGAGLTEEQLTVYQGAMFFFHRYISRGKAPVSCSYIYFPTSEVGPILANNLDTVPEEPYLPPHWPGVSENIILGGVSSGVFLDEESPEIFPAPVYQLVGRYCRTTDEAVDMLKRYNLFWGPGNLLVVDRNSRVAMIEKTSTRMSVRYSPDGFGFITAMTQQDPELREYVAGRQKASLKDRGLPEDCDDTAYWGAQHKRLDLMNELLDDARKNPTLDTLQKMIQFRSPTRGNVAGNGDPVRPGVPGCSSFEHTIKTQIWVLREGRALWWARDNEKCSPSWENRQPDVKLDTAWC